MGDKMKQAGASIGRYLIYVLVVILLGGGYAGVRSFLSSHSKQFAKGDYPDLNPLVEQGKDLPLNEFGKLSIHWVVGSFASEENSYTSYGAKFSAGKSYYYMALLDDFSVITIQANDSNEVQRLADMTKAFKDAENIYTLSAEDFEGQLQPMTNKKLKGFYDEALDAAGFSKNEMFKPRYVILNTGAIPSQNIAMIFGVIAMAIIVLVVVLRMRKKRRTEEAQADVSPMDAQTPQ